MRCSLATADSSESKTAFVLSLYVLLRGSIDSRRYRAAGHIHIHAHTHFHFADVLGNGFTLQV